MKTKMPLPSMATLAGLAMALPPADYPLARRLAAGD